MLDASGTIDAGFRPTRAVPASTSRIAAAPGGRWYVAGGSALVRLDADGTLDTTFAAGTGFDALPTSMAVQADGSLLFSGSFTHYNGVAASRLVRVLTNGTLDPDFALDASIDELPGIGSFVPGENGRILALRSPETRGATEANQAGVVLLEPASPPQITLQPVAQSTTAGSPVTLSVAATSSALLAYQWRRDGLDIPGAPHATYTLPSAQRHDAGAYTVVLFAGSAAVESGSAQVDIASPPESTARLINLSTRAFSPSGSDVLVPGFVIGGQAGKRLLLRAVGPTLAGDPYGLSSVLPDPRLRLLRRNDATGGYVEFAGNDDWETNANVADILTTSAELFAFELQDAREAVLLLDLPAGQYTAIADDGTGTGGTAIVELYDADLAPEPNMAPGSTLINLSNRGFAGSGDSVMIPGFVVSGPGAMTCLIRVAGPALRAAPYHVATAMLDPRLDVYRREHDGSENRLFGNDDWSEGPDPAHVSEVAARVSAFPFVSGSLDAALVVTLPPGVYTVHGCSASPTGTGSILVEIYAVP